LCIDSEKGRKRRESRELRVESEFGAAESRLDLAGPNGAVVANAQSFLSVLFASCSHTLPHTYTHTHTHMYRDKCALYCGTFVEITFNAVTDSSQVSFQLTDVICQTAQKIRS